MLHDLGAISMISSDSQAMGRVGENWLRAVQTADAMKRARGALPEDAAGNDNFRVLRFVAKVTLNPAITFGLSDLLGSIAPGKMADLVLWEPAFFGAKPKMVIKGGLIVWALMGDPNASLPTPQPMFYRPMFGAYGKTLQETCVTFVSRAAYERGVKDALGLQRRVVPVTGTRVLTKQHMVRNGNTPKIEVNPETFAVTVDGVHATVPPAKSIALNQLYFFSWRRPRVPRVPRVGSTNGSHSGDAPRCPVPGAPGQARPRRARPSNHQETSMIVIDSVAGNLREPDWQARLAGARVDRLLLDQWQAQRRTASASRRRAGGSWPSPSTGTPTCATATSWSGTRTSTWPSSPASSSRTCWSST